MIIPFFYNQLLRKIYTWKYPNFKKDLINTIKYGSIIKFIILTAIHWVFMSVAFYYFTLGITSESIAFNSYFIAILPVSWTLGLLALFAPLCS